MKKKILVLLLMSTLLLAGCWDSKELNNLSIITGGAVDLKDLDLYELTIQTVKTTAQSGGGGNEGGGSSSGNQVILSATGNSVFDASRNLSTRIDRSQYWPHAQIIAIGQNLAKKDIGSVIDFVSRNSQVRQSIYFILSDTEGKQILNNIPDANDNSSIEATRLIKNSSITGFGIDETLVDFAAQRETLSGVSLMNYLKSFPMEKSSPDDKQEYRSVLAGTGVFYQDKLVTTLNRRETRATNWLNDNIKSTVFTVDYGDTGQDNVTLDIRNSKVKLTPSLKDDKYVMDAKLFIEAYISEYSVDTYPDEISLQKLQSQIENKIEMEIKKTFEKSKNDIGLDIFNLARTFTRENPKLIHLTQKQWRDIYQSQVFLNVDVNLEVVSSGLLFKN